MPVLANLRSFAGKQVLRRVNEVIRHARLVNLGKRPQRCGSLARFLVPVAASPIRGLQRFNELHGLAFRKVVAVRLPRETAETRRLVPLRRARSLEGSTWCSPH